MKPRAWLCVVLCSAACWNTGCDDTLKRVSSIEETRVLGARGEAEVAPARSSPELGERATVRFFLAAPSGAPNVSYALSACAVTPSFDGSATCASAPFATEPRLQPSTEGVQISFQVPLDLDLKSTPDLLVTGLVCPDSALRLDLAPPARCISGAGTQVEFELELADEEGSNLNPNIAADAVTLDGSPWLGSSNVASCDELVQVSPNSLHRLGIGFAAEDFELLPRTTALDPERERLLVSFFADGGELKHAFVSVEATSMAASRELSWSSPPLDDETPRVVHFYLVVRDDRGGEDFATRALCVRR